MNFGDLSNICKAPPTFLTSGLKPPDRVAIFTTSGQTSLGFTDDRDQLNSTLLRLAPHPIARSTAQVTEGKDILHDEVILLCSQQDIGPEARLRCVEVWVEEKNETMVFITKNFKLAASTIAAI